MMSALDTLTPSAPKGAEWALLNELVRLLEMTHENIENIENLRDVGLHKWPETADVRCELRQIAETVEVLDVLSWREIIDRGPVIGGES